MANDRMALLRLLRQRGWRVVQNSHTKCYAPDGKTIVVMSSSGTGRGLDKDIKRIKRADPGIEVHF